MLLKLVYNNATMQFVTAHSVIVKVLDDVLREQKLMHYEI